jgi:hypothetical protein
MKRLLAVSWEMPPMPGPRAVQVSRVLGELPALNWRPTVVCLGPRRGGPHWFDGAAPLPAGVELVRVPSPEEWFVVRAGWRLAPWLRDYPDSTRVWVARATRAALAIAAAGDVAGLITFAQPWSDHLVGLRVHRATKLPWIAHFSDPWTDSPYTTPRQRTIGRPLEAEVVREASAVVFVTEETAALTMAKYPDSWRSKVAVVPHGFDPQSTPAATPPSDPNRPVRLVYTGRFYTGVRTPLALLRALAEMNRTEPMAERVDVTFVGPHTIEFARDAAALGLDSFVHFRGRVSAEDAATFAAGADVLLMIDAPSPAPDVPSVFLPSKLVDYLPLRKPILGITPDPGAAARLLHRLGCLVAPPADVPAIASALRDVIARWRAGTLGVGPSFDVVAAEFDIRRTARLLDAVMSRAFA